MINCTDDRLRDFCVHILRDAYKSLVAQYRGCKSYIDTHPEFQPSEEKFFRSASYIILSGGYGGTAEQIIRQAKREAWNG